jgi:hypothetical protein
MTAGEKRNMAASVRARLTNLARTTGQDFQRLLLRFVVERFLYRLDRSGHSNDFLLKGAMLFAARGDWPYRSTRDLDLLGVGESTAEKLANTIRNLCTVKVEDDGVQYDPDSVTVEAIREARIEGGLRVVLFAALEQARIRMRIDVGFGDTVLAPEWIEVRSLLDFSSFLIQAYPKESVVAEKTQTLLALGEINSRVKDYYDIWALSRNLSFDGTTLVSTVAAVLVSHDTRVPSGNPDGLTDSFAEARKTMWQGFLRRVQLSGSVPDLHDVLVQLRDFLLPPLEAVRDARPFVMNWPPGGPWQPNARHPNA